MNVAFIPARGGSKGIPFKNVRLLSGRPLIQWVTQAALGSSAIDLVYVSTDSDSVRFALSDLACPRLQVIDRSAETAGDTSSTESAMLEFAKRYEFDKVVLLQATSPLTTATDIDAAFSLYRASGADSLLSCVRQKRFIWRANGDRYEPVNYDPKHRPRRQEFDGFLMENGALYITRRDLLIRDRCRLSGSVAVYEMREATALELDEPHDWLIMEALMRTEAAHASNSTARELFRSVNLLVSDFDGVFTDNRVIVEEHGTESVVCSRSDGFGISLLRKAGIECVVISREHNPVVGARCAKLGIEVHQGIDNKLECLKMIASRHLIVPRNICYIGNDLDDIECIRFAGLGVTVADAYPETRAHAAYVTANRGGYGAIREIVDLIIAGRNA